MWRTILLGKLGVSIVASLVVGGVCISQPWRKSYTFLQSSSWVGVGAFFFLLALAQITAIYFMTRKPRHLG
jgi:hypothetical protein